MRADKKNQVKTLKTLSQMIAEKTGLHFPDRRLNELRDKFHLASLDFGYQDIESCLYWLLSEPNEKGQVEKLASHLTIGETYFFRDLYIFNELEKHVLPELISLKRKKEKSLRIWSAGCSSGEEPYSIAILLKKILPDFKDWDITIHATDINPQFLAKASMGVYKDWSFRGTPEWVKKGFFGKDSNGHYKIHSNIRNAVRFSYHNLADDPFPSLVNNTTSFDIIFCRNVLMYFRPNLISRIVDKFYHSLLDSGWLVVSGSEGILLQSSEFEMVNFPDSIFYRKNLLRKGFDKGRTDEWVSPGKNHTAIHETKKAPLPVGKKQCRNINHESKPEVNKKSIPVRKVKTEKSTYQKALDLYEQGLYDEIIRMPDPMNSKEKDNTQLMKVIARAYSNLGKFNVALELCENIISTEYFDAGCHYLKGLILQEIGKTDEAIKSFMKSIYLDPDFILAHFALGNIFLRKGDQFKSEKHIDNVKSILENYSPETIIPESDGLSAGRLNEIMKAISQNQ